MATACVPSGAPGRAALRRCSPPCRPLRVAAFPHHTVSHPPAGYGSLAHTPGESPTQLCTASDAGGAASAASSGRSASGKRTPARCIQQQHCQPPLLPNPSPTRLPIQAAGGGLHNRLPPRLLAGVHRPPRHARGARAHSHAAPRAGRNYCKREQAAHSLQEQ